MHVGKRFPNTKWIGAFSLLLLSACVSLQNESIWRDAQKSLIGKSYQDIIQCAGSPDSIDMISNQTRILHYKATYNNISNSSDYCKLSMKFENGVLASMSKISDAPGTAPGFDSSGAQYCGAIVRQCVK
jgi:hypothetical protein